MIVQKLITTEKNYLLGRKANFFQIFKLQNQKIHAISSQISFEGEEAIMVKFPLQFSFDQCKLPLKKKNAIYL